MEDLGDQHACQQAGTDWVVKHDCRSTDPADGNPARGIARQQPGGARPGLAVGCKGTLDEIHIRDMDGWRWLG
jgi:hypothetical protein